MEISTTLPVTMPMTALLQELADLMDYISEYGAGHSDLAMQAIERRRILLLESKRREAILHEIFQGKPENANIPQ